MEIKTKFDLGQRVYIIQKSGQLIKRDCPACNGNGNIVNEKNFVFHCENCQGSGITETWYSTNWQIAYEKAKIGRVGVELYRETFINRGSEKNRITYMVDETGVGSGSLWNEDDIFATKEEALEECEKRNLVLEEN